MTVTMQRVSFASGDTHLIGNLYTPEGDQGTRLPAIVVTGTWTSVKEQMANRYAEQMASHGFAALSFDFTHFGESAGAIRDYESPVLKVQDIHHAITYLSSRPEVDPDRIAALGVCASAGYTAMNAVADGRVQALAVIAPWLHNAEIVEQIYEGQAGVARRIAAAKAARIAFESTGEVRYVPAVEAGNSDAAMPWDIDFYLNPRRGGIPQWPNRFAVMSWAEWLTFDPIAVARRISVPTLMVHSEEAAIPQGAHRFFDDLSAPKRELWVTGDQFAFYDGPAHVTRASAEAAAHFRQHLGGGQG